jgi:tetratricopeptide (TPR) repeat protein
VGSELGEEDMGFLEALGAQFHLALGTQYLAEGRYLDALGELDQAVRGDPACYDAHLHRGQAYLQLQRFGEAADAFSEAVRLRPGSVEAQHLAGYASECAGRFDGTRALYGTAMPLEPGTPEHGMGMRRVAERAGRTGVRPADSPCFEEVPREEALPPGIPPNGVVVVREIVRIPCQYCGTLVDITRTTCQSCGAPLR